MLIEYNPDEWEVVSESHTCAYHKKNPLDRSWPGCTCSGSYGLRRKDPYPSEEVNRESLAQIRALCATPEEA